MSKAIAIVGCGGIGARHAQALGRTVFDTVVYALDPDERATERAAALFADSKKATGSPATIVRCHHYAELGSPLDVAIVATRASERLRSLEQLLEVGAVRHLILEKFLFSRRDHFAIAKALLNRLGVSAWVNCPRRIYPGYQEIATRMQDSRFVHIEVSASAKVAPIGTIGIHFVDLLQFLCGSCTAPTRLSLTDAQLVPGNRNLSDFSGMLEAFYGSKRLLRYAAIAETDAPLVVSIVGDNIRYVVDESNQCIYASSAQNRWRFEMGEFPVPLQSGLTHAVAEDLIATGTCGLTPYCDSAAVHVAMLDAILCSYRAIEDDLFLEELPFT